ncbi:PREDICTED: uncharacterized protein LOC109236129 [Nicotiana attenuata]|uniref:uncharacterized protein LOC109236129 n=1 Tax=Nicotiana attenuata TaxID=49451 RepID=UPI000904E101|nr:PREDICTED: uncharacterized protein LOC109236129 [Nicotiana attenuata]
MECLSSNLKTLKQEKAFHYRLMCSRLDLTHLRFADDLLLFTRGDATFVALLHDKFNIFSAATGLKANPTKSSIYYGGVSSEVKHDIQQILGYSQGTLPFRSFGTPLDIKKLSVMQLQPLIDKIVARISFWTTKKLSYAGNTFTMQDAYMPTFVYIEESGASIPLTRIRDVALFWAVSSETLQMLVESYNISVKFELAAVGLNLINLALWNKAAITKICWELANKKDKLWIKWIHSYYIKDQVFATMRAPKQASWMVRKILEQGVIWISLASNNPAHKRTIIKQERLLTADRLKNWDSTPSYNIVDCWHHWIVMKTNGRSQVATLLKLVYTEYTHTVWIERNARIIEKQGTTYDVLAREWSACAILELRVILVSFLQNVNAE